MLLWCLWLDAEWLVFEGISVDESGKQHYLDATVAYKRAVLNCIHYLAKFGYTKEQVSCSGHMNFA
jgi:formamidase